MAHFFHAIPDGMYKKRAPARTLLIAITMLTFAILSWALKGKRAVVKRRLTRLIVDGRFLLGKLLSDLISITYEDAYDTLEKAAASGLPIVFPESGGSRYTFSTHPNKAVKELYRNECLATY